MKYGSVPNFAKFSFYPRNDGTYVWIHDHEMYIPHPRFSGTITYVGAVLVGQLVTLTSKAGSVRSLSSNSKWKPCESLSFYAQSILFLKCVLINEW